MANASATVARRIAVRSPGNTCRALTVVPPARAPRGPAANRDEGVLNHDACTAIPAGFAAGRIGPNEVPSDPWRDLSSTDQLNAVGGVA